MGYITKMDKADCDKLYAAAGTAPFGEAVIPRVGPPRCVACGGIIGACEHTGHLLEAMYYSEGEQPY